MARWAAAGERGLGDTAARLLGTLGVTMAEAYERITGRPCGCTGRQAKLNAMYPYEGDRGELDG